MAVDLAKSFVRGYARRGPSGAETFVEPHVDSRIHTYPAPSYMAPVAAQPAESPEQTPEQMPQEAPEQGQQAVGGAEDGLGALQTSPGRPPDAGIFRYLQSPGFMQWFGDWENADKHDNSQVVDDNGQPLPVYPLQPAGAGSGDGREYDTPPFGPGLYFISQPPASLAGAPGSALGEPAGVPMQHRAQVNEYARSLMEGSGRPDVPAPAQALFAAHGDTAMLHPDAADPIRREIDRYASQLSGSSPAPAFLSIWHPLRVHDRVSPSRLEAMLGSDPPLREAVRRSTQLRTGVENWPTVATGGDLISGIQSIGRMHDVPRVIMSGGYDGIQHQDRAAGTPEFWMALRPEQVLSSVSVAPEPAVKSLLRYPRLTILLRLP